jgi:hypothetical protein
VGVFAGHGLTLQEMTGDPKTGAAAGAGTDCPWGIDDWRLAKRMPSRGSAIRELLRRGLAAEGIKTTGTVGDSND